MEEFDLRKYLDENKLVKESNDLGFIPEFGQDHHMVFKNPIMAYEKLAKSNIPHDVWDNIGFVFPKMTQETWWMLEDIFDRGDVGDQGRLDL